MDYFLNLLRLVVQSEAKPNKAACSTGIVHVLIDEVLWPSLHLPDLFFLRRRRR
jgi:hypothetical protein